jgi:hypothetical protein
MITDGDFRFPAGAIIRSVPRPNTKFAHGIRPPAVTGQAVQYGPGCTGCIVLF